MNEIAQETEIFKATPSLKDSWGWLLIGILCIPMFGLGLLVILAVWIKSKTTEYRLTTERLFVKTGLIAKSVQELELYRIKDVSYQQGLIQRMLGVGHVTVISNDASTPKIRMVSVPSPETLKEQLRTAYRDSRRIEKVRVAEHTS